MGHPFYTLNPTLPNIRQYFNYTDDKLIEIMYKKSNKYKDINGLIYPFVNKGRKLYKPAYVYYHGYKSYTRRQNTNLFFSRLIQSRYEKQVEMSSYLVERLKPYIPDIKDLDIILEVTPVRSREVAGLGGFQFWDDKLGEYESLTPEIIALNEYLSKNRRSYIFCIPEHYEPLRELSRKGEMNKIFGELKDK